MNKITLNNIDYKLATDLDTFLYLEEYTGEHFLDYLNNMTLTRAIIYTYCAIKQCCECEFDKTIDEFKAEIKADPEGMGKVLMIGRDAVKEANKVSLFVLNKLPKEDVQKAIELEKEKAKSKKK